MSEPRAFSVKVERATTDRWIASVGSLQVVAGSPPEALTLLATHWAARDPDQLSASAWEVTND